MPVTSSRDVECVSYRIIIIRRGEQRGSVHPRTRSVHVIHQSVTHPYKIRIHYFREMYSDRQVLKLRRRFVVRGNCNCCIQARACSLTEKVVPEFRLGYRFSTTNVHPGRRKGIRERLCIVDHWSGHVKFRGRSEYELMSARRFEACTGRWSSSGFSLAASCLTLAQCHPTTTSQVRDIAAGTAKSRHRSGISFS